MSAYSDHARDIPARVRTSVPALAACLLALALGVMGARVDHAHAAPDAVKVTAPAGGTDGASFTRSVHEDTPATAVDIIAVAASPAGGLSLHE